VNGNIHHKCNECGYETDEEIQAKGHTQGEFKSKTDPDCVNPGTETYICSVCQQEFTIRTSSPLGHEDLDNDGICDRCYAVLGGGTSIPICPGCEHDHDGTEDHCACHLCCALTPELVKSARDAELRGLALREQVR
jgi:hypothetical protein